MLRSRIDKLYTAFLYIPKKRNLACRITAKDDRSESLVSEVLVLCRFAKTINIIFCIRKNITYLKIKYKKGLKSD